MAVRRQPSNQSDINPGQVGLNTSDLVLSASMSELEFQITTITYHNIPLYKKQSTGKHLAVRQIVPIDPN